MAAMVATPEDPDEVVGFLMTKFSALIDRVQAAESQHESAKQATEALEVRVRDSKQRHSATSANLQATLQAQREASARASKELASAREAVDGTNLELRQAKKSVAVLQQQCQHLNNKCQEEHANLADTAGAAAQADEAWAACEVERERLRAEVTVLREQMATVEEELVAAREFEQHRCADVKALEDKIAEAGRAWHEASRRAQAQHEELCGALKTVTLYRERLDSARHALLHKEEELQVADAEVDGLQEQLAKTDEEVAAASRNLARLGEVKTALERAKRENAEVHEILKAAHHARQACVDEGVSLTNRQSESEARLATMDQRLTAGEVDVQRGRERLRLLREGLRRCEERRRALSEEQHKMGNAGQNLQQELQRVFADMERTRAESQEVQEAGDDLQRRLRAAEPALESAKRRAVELQANLEDAKEETLRTQARKEALLQEVNQCRDKMRGLRRRHANLNERGRVLEQRLLRSSGAFGGTAGFAAAAAAVGQQGSAVVPCVHPSEGSRVRTPRSCPSRTPRPSSAPSRRQEAEPAAVLSPTLACRSSVTPSGNLSTAPSSLKDPAVTESLGYLKQWIELEEARIGTTRTPPKPCSQPPSPAAKTPPAKSTRAGSWQCTTAAAEAAEASRKAAALPEEPSGPRGGELLVPYPMVHETTTPSTDQVDVGNAVPEVPATNTPPTDEVGMGASEHS